MSKNNKKTMNERTHNPFEIYRSKDLDKTNSNYPLENFVFQDYLKHSSNATDSKALPYISYDRTSVRVIVKTDGATDYNEIPKTEQLLHKQEHRTMCCMIRWIKG